MSTFTTFLDAIAKGDVRHDLFLVSNPAVRGVLMVDLFNDANDRGMLPVVRKPGMVVELGPSEAVFRVAYMHIATEMHGRVFTGVHGLSTLDKYEDSEAIKVRIYALVRP